MANQAIITPNLELGPILKGASAALESNHVLKASPGRIFKLTVAHTYTTSGVWVLLFDTAAVPADGAVTPDWAFPLAAATSQAQGGNIDWNSYPREMVHGICVALSSATSPFTLTSQPNAFFSWQVQ
ncbi:MAG: hypothetical protein ACREQ4_02475 [Candidatus Binataceae bacterium]